MFCSTFQLGPRKFQGGRGGGGELKDSLTLLNWSFKWRLIQNHNQNHHFEDNALFSGGDAQKRNARIFEHSISDRIAFPHIIMFHDYNYTFSSHLPKTTFSRSCQKPLFFTIDKSHYSRSRLEFFLRLLKSYAVSFSLFSHAISLQLSTSHSFPALFTSKVPYHPVHIFTFSPAHALRIQWLLPFLSGIGLKLLTSLITARPFSYISSVRHSIMCDPPHGSAT